MWFFQWNKHYRDIHTSAVEQNFHQYKSSNYYEMFVV